MKLVVVDLELDAPGLPEEAVIQIGACQLDCRTGRVDAGRRWYVNVGRPIQPFITELTAITQAQVDAGLPIAAALQEWWAYVGSKPVAAWGRDVWQLVQLSRDIGVAHKTPRTLDVKSLGMVMRAAHGSKTAGGLKATMDLFGIEFVGRQHDGQTDAENTARLLWRWTRCVQILDGARQEFSRDAT